VALLALGGGLWNGETLRAQSYPQIAPKPVEPVGTAGNVPANSPMTTAPSDNTVVVEKLKGLVFVPTPKDVAMHGTRASGIVLKNVTVPDETDFRAKVSPWLGQKLTRGDLNTMVSAIILFYRQHDRPIVDVAVPQQDVTNGVVQVILLEGRVGVVKVTGNRWVSSSEIRDDVSLQPGDEISADTLQGDLDWMNQNPFHTTDLIYHPGAELGQTDLILQTKDRFPARIYAGYEDSGNDATGLDRYEAGFNWGDAFDLGLGQQMNYQYTTSGDGDSLRAHAGSYIIPLPWHNTFTVFGSYVDTRGEIPPYFGIAGRSYQISGRYGIPLPDLSIDKYVYRHTFTFGFDYKYNNNSLEFATLPASGTLYDVDQFEFGYNGSMPDPWGQTTLDNEVYYSPGDWGGHDTDYYYGIGHAGATSSYFYDNLSLERITHLPWNWSLVLKGTLQWSNENLEPSEQLGFGGYDTIRGYDEREVNTDEGYIFNTELRTPTISFGQIFGCTDFQDQLQFLTFWDYGDGFNHTLLPGEPSDYLLSSVGGGVRYSINTYVSVRFDYGFQLIHTGFDSDHGSRSDLGIVVSY
jgi:hemolysin activation/secretion protein